VLLRVLLRVLAPRQRCRGRARGGRQLLLVLPGGVVRLRLRGHARSIATQGSRLGCVCISACICTRCCSCCCCCCWQRLREPGQLAAHLVRHTVAQRDHDVTDGLRVCVCFKGVRGVNV
jgi:hypothetical protein